MSWPANQKRNHEICMLLDKQRLSYAVIAEMMGVSRNIVAGVAFRRRHPFKALVSSPGSAGPNKIGHGYQPPSYWPEKTATNTR